MIKGVNEEKDHPMKGVVGALTEDNLVNFQLQDPTWGPLEPSIDDLGCFFVIISLFDSILLQYIRESSC